MDTQAFHQQTTRQIHTARRLVADGVDRDEYVSLEGEVFRLGDAADTLTPAEAPELYPIN